MAENPSSQNPSGQNLSGADVGAAVDKLEDLARNNPDQARSAIDKVQDVINDRTGGKFSDLVDKGGDFVEGRLGLPEQGQGEVPADAPQTPTDSTGTPDPVDNPDPGPADPAEVPGPNDPDHRPAEPVPAPDQPAPGDPDADPTPGTGDTGPAQDGDTLG